MQHAYTQPGKKVVLQTIHLTDGVNITSMLTINVVDTSALASYALVVTPSALFATLGDSVTFTPRVIGTPLATMIMQVQDFGDGTTQKNADIQKKSDAVKHAYSINGTALPTETIFIDQCNYLKTQATIAVQ